MTVLARLAKIKLILPVIKHSPFLLVITFSHLAPVVQTADNAIHWI